MLHDLEDIVTLDFETYYSKEYSLSLKKYNTSSYIWDEQFKAHCIGIADGTKPAVWYGPDEIAAALRKHAAFTRPVAAHNMMFDGFILSQHYDCIPPFYYDTMCMAPALEGQSVKHSLDAMARLYRLGVKTEGLLNTKGKRELSEDELDALGEYCANDTDLCRMLLPIMLKHFPDKELRLIDWSIRAFCDPKLFVDQALAKEEHSFQVNRKVNLQQTAGLPPEILLSDVKLSDALEALGVDVPQKISPTTGQFVPAFSKQDKVFTELLEHDDPMVVALVEARLATKSTIGESRAQRFIDIGKRPLPMAYKYAAAHTLRFGGTNRMNMQNLERGGRLRKAIMAPPGHVILACDSAQIEARKNAWFWDQLDVLKLFADGEDVYKMQASRTFSRALDSITKDERFVGKVQTLAMGYGMGWRKYQSVLALGLMGMALQVEDGVAQQHVQAYRATNAKIKSGWDWCDKLLADMCVGSTGERKCIGWERDRIWLPSGLGLYYKGLRGVETVDRNGHTTISDFTYVAKKNGGRSKLWGGTVTENLIQALSRCAVTDQMLLVMDGGWNVVGMTHDEIIVCCPKELASRCADEMLAAMRTVPAWCPGVPFNAEIEIGERYS